MNSSQKTTHGHDLSPNQDLIVSFETAIKNQSKRENDLVLTKLNYLCQHFDPYDRDHRSSEVNNILTEFSLMNLLDNPFTFTNILLQMIDKLQTLQKERLN